MSELEIPEMPRDVAMKMVEHGLRGFKRPAIEQLADEVQRAYEMGYREAVGASQRREDTT